MFQGTATDILGPGTGPIPVAVKVATMYLCTHVIVIYGYRLFNQINTINKHKRYLLV